jgi:hypothetical protein
MGGTLNEVGGARRMEIGRFKARDTLLLHDGTRAEVLSPSEDGRRVRARYLDSPEDPTLDGTEGLIAAHEVSAFSPAPPGPDWADRLTVVVHRVPDSEESEGRYGAVTMAGVPLGVSVEATDADTAEGALERLLGALKAFGYSGPVAVEDATYVGGIERYEVEVG